MEYNTQLSKLILPEYGRHIHKMVEFACKIENREERNKAAKTIVSIMSQLNPVFKDSNPEHKQKLWDQLAIISDFKLDVDYPFAPPKREDVYVKPQVLENPQVDIKYRHYGKNLEEMIGKVSKMENNEDRETLITQIANHMKRSYLTWNRESVTDEFIYDDIFYLSKARIKVNNGAKLTETREILSKNKKPKHNKHK